MYSIFAAEEIGILSVSYVSWEAIVHMSTRWSYVYSCLGIHRSLDMRYLKLHSTPMMT